MPAKDKFHDIVKAALIREGWTITHDPYFLFIGKRKACINLGAERTIGAEKEGERIAVEVKSFLGESVMDDLEKALGQYGLYRVRLKRHEPERILYLAVPLKLRPMLLEERDFREALTELHVRLIMFDPKQEQETEWIDPNNMPL